MVNLKNALIFIGCLFFSACYAEMHYTLGRTNRDPFMEIPTVTSFNGDFSIVVSWSMDEAADAYYLYRAADEINPQYQLVYQGEHTEYRDDFFLTNEEELYLYRLGKRRGSMQFVDLTTRGKAGLGVVSGSLRDFHEPNDNIYTATLLDKNELFSNSWLYYSNYLDGINIYDEDWYCVDIPSRWIATIILTDLDPISQHASNHFKIEIWGIGSESIISALPKDIFNPTDYHGRFYFRIYPDFTVFQQFHPLPMGGYGAFIRYSLKVSSLRPE